MINDTICAISTPLSKGAISIVRMSGEDAFSIASKILHIPTSKMKPNTIIYGHVYDDEEIVDEVLVSFFAKRKSFTWEDMVEINCHGGVYITRQIFNLLLRQGCRLALPGEFSQRAYLNGRINLAQAEASSDLIEASSSLKAQSAIKSLTGSTQRLIDPLLNEMKDILANVELNIDYPEYEDEKQISSAILLPALEKWQKKVQVIIKEAESFLQVRNGLKTAIVGKPNVGKSSLLNALLAKNRAIVTDIAGTTRDVLEEEVMIDNLSLHLIDTAGIRESEDTIEKIGIERSKRAIAEADLVLLLFDGSKALEKEDKLLLDLTAEKDRLIIYNKKDLGFKDKPLEGLSISAKNNDLKALKDYLKTKYEPNMMLASSDVLNNERQLALMKESFQHLCEAKNNLAYYALDLVSIDLNEAYRCLCDILGKEYRDDLIDHLFRHFCVGK